MNHLFTTFFDAGEHRETLILKKLRFYVLLGIKFPSEVRVTLEEFTPQGCASFPVGRRSVGAARQQPPNLAHPQNHWFA